jgi:hypothetical protein
LGKKVHAGKPAIREMTITGKLPRIFLTYQSSKNQWLKTGKGKEAKKGRGKRATGAFLVQSGRLVPKP